MKRSILAWWWWALSSALFLLAATRGEMVVQPVSIAEASRQAYQQQWKSSGLESFPLREGDLLVRSGKSFFSNELRKFSRRDPTYSHCGWITQEEGKWVVYHAIGGTDNPDNRLRRDPLYAFCNPIDVSQFAVYRYNLAPEDLSASTKKARELYLSGVSFDLKFTLDDNSELYCAEFIWEILKETQNRAEFISLSRLNDKLYIGVDDLYLNNYCEKIFEYAYH